MGAANAFREWLKENWLTENIIFPLLLLFFVIPVILFVGLAALWRLGCDRLGALYTLACLSSLVAVMGAGGWLAGFLVEPDLVGETIDREYVQERANQMKRGILKFLPEQTEEAAYRMAAQIVESCERDQIERLKWSSRRKVQHPCAWVFCVGLAVAGLSCAVRVGRPREDSFQKGLDTTVMYLGMMLFLAVCAMQIWLLFLR